VEGKICDIERKFRRKGDLFVSIQGKVIKNEPIEGLPDPVQGQHTPHTPAPQRHLAILPTGSHWIDGFLKKSESLHI
jgi:hypothetical protein